MKNIRIPEKFSEFKGEELMSNFDGRIEIETAKSIKGKSFFSTYSGWNFYGKVWWQNNKWCCEVWCWGSWKETVICDDLADIMEEVSSKYGHE